MEGDKINPYNFVPLKEKPDRTPWEELPKHRRLDENLYSGSLCLRFFALTPLCIPSTAEKDVEKYGEKKTFTRFRYDSAEKPILPGTSIRGMIRAIFEALTNSCMVHFDAVYEDKKFNKKYYNKPEYKRCSTTGLCRACSVFGTVGEDAQGLCNRSKVIFTDAVGQPSILERGKWILKELSSPKPERHVSFYAADGKSSSSGPRGRKLYFHHDKDKLSIEQAEHTQRNRKICERVKSGGTFESTVLFQGLQEEDLAYLLCALALQEGLAHKIGMGKSLGLGSVKVTIQSSRIYKGPQRYKQLNADQSPDSDLKQIEKLREKVLPMDAILEDLLRYHPPKQGTMAYPSWEWFRNNGDKILGEYGEYEKKKQEIIKQEIIKHFIYNEKITGTIYAIQGKEVFIKAEDGRLFLRSMQLVQGVKAAAFHIGLQVVLEGKKMELLK